MNCPACGNVLPEGAAFCPSCGVKQEPVVEPVVEAIAAEPTIKATAEAVAVEQTIEVEAEAVVEPTIEVAAEAVADPAAEAAELTLAPEVVEEAFAEPVAKTAAEDVAETPAEAVAQPVPATLVVEPVAQSASEVVSEQSVAEPVVETTFAAEVVAEPAARPESVAQFESQPMAQTVVQSAAAEPVAQLETQPAAQLVSAVQPEPLSAYAPAHAATPQTPPAYNADAQQQSAQAASVPSAYTQSAAYVPPAFGAQPQPQPQPQPQQPGFAQQPQTQQPQSGYQHYQQPGYAQQPQPGNAPTAQPGFAQQSAPTAQPGFAQQPVYAQGCVTAAWADVRSDKSLIKKSLLLGLILCVPILNFVVYGYALNWAREVPFGGRTPLPQKIITGRNFEMGFYVFLIGLVIGLVAGFATGILALIPLLGWLAAIVVCLGASMLQYLLVLRMGIMQQLSEGFKITLAWDAMKRNWKSLLCAVLVPSLVAAGVILVVSLVATLLMMVGAVPLGFAAYDGGFVGGVLALTGMGVMAIVCVLAALACGICTAVAVLVGMRAVAHWVARYAPEWANDAYQAQPTQCTTLS